MSSQSQPRKPLYENVGIGTILKRIGECNALVGDYGLSVFLTQQHRELERECRDLCITVGSKAIIIDFKAPNQIRVDARSYERVELLVAGLENLIRSNSYFVGFLHAALRLDFNGQPTGYFMHIATPMTTIFIPLNYIMKLAQIQNGKAKFNTVRITDIRYRPTICEDRLTSILRNERLVVAVSRVPSCYQGGFLCRHVSYDCLLMIEELLRPLCRVLLRECLDFYCRYCCLSCGSLCRVHAEVHATATNRAEITEGYTLARLLWLLRTGRIGYSIESDRMRAELLRSITAVIDRLGRGRDVQPHLYMFVYTPGLGVQAIPIGSDTSIL